MVAWEISRYAGGDAAERRRDKKSCQPAALGENTG
jgi:hypothetical protein